MKYLNLIFAIAMIGCAGAEDESQSNHESSDENSDELTHDTTGAGGFEALYFTGQLGGKYEIYMYLMVPNQTTEYDGPVTGYYYYTSQKKQIELGGKIRDGELELNEFVGIETTGHFSGALTGDRSGFFGTWSNDKSELDFDLGSATEGDYDVNMLLVQDDEVLDWEGYKSSFELATFPFEMQGQMEESEFSFDTSTVKKFMFTEEDEFEDFGWNNYVPIIRYEYNGYHVMVIEHYYTPGAFGINNWFVEMYTYTENGELIDMAMIGCNCHDTNMGANDYYSTNEHITFYDDGSTLVESEHIHATLFEEDVEDGQELIDERENQIETYAIDANGMIIKTDFESN